jgi:hypothetical protein
MSRYYRKTSYESHQDEWNAFKGKLSLIENELKGLNNFNFLSKNNYEKKYPVVRDNSYSSQLFILPK